MATLDPRIAAVTDRIKDKSRKGREAYLKLMDEEGERGIDRTRLSCGNFAHGFAASGDDKKAIRTFSGPNIGIITAYNDMLSAHAPYYRYPEQMKVWAREAGATAQVAGGVPAMCDGVTQGQPGMDLSLFSRDNIAMGVAIALSHGMFEGVAMLGICDKIVPGLLIGALRFGHVPAILVPAGPMPSGLANKEKQRVRQLFAEGKATKEELLAAESASYHGMGTCTFYGTANSNQMMMEMMGLHIPGAAFANPGTKLRQNLTRAAVHRIVELANNKARLCDTVDERAIVNAAVGLMATGGSTNHMIHLPAIARAAGISFDWQDLADLSAAVPLIARVYPNGSGDTNDFHHAGGMAFVTHTLREHGLVHDLQPAGHDDFAAYATNPVEDGEGLKWEKVTESSNDTMLRPVGQAFQPDGGMRLLSGNLGRACFKTSAVEKERWTIEAPCRIFEDQPSVVRAFEDGELDKDVVVVVRFQGPRANGMPELHKLTPPLGVLQDRGHKVALVTDGRMSGASGKVPAAIHCSPEAKGGGPLSLLRNGDMVRVCAETGTLSTDADLSAREPAPVPRPPIGTGRELFALFRHHADEAEKGGSAMLDAMEAEL
ncbi:phosphogluconate dehydratase [Sphingomicrobium sediminis]|uniref:Phosphogluconate dehydratase n=1 Tax=Sphingomicrobium sediminis TaxID=2950949 RepID=A0A9X2EJ51_9SPHN|nr:phosphogluconate dehydratase [Sphingomicrobium sediminis]MCM8556217.1 phosphogluconate dehydratase [Sphingomicrobium sediminis]